VAGFLVAVPWGNPTWRVKFNTETGAIDTHHGDTIACRTHPVGTSGGSRPGHWHRRIRADVRTIVDEVREGGDEALREFSRRFDDVDVEALDVTDATERAAERIDPEIRDAIESAAANVRAFHERQVRTDWTDSFDDVELGRQFRPIRRVGAYVPGGSAAYPSTALMTVVPAKVAGVEEVVVVTPPADELNPVTLAAIGIAGADEVYSVGGAQAIAGLAYGTETMPAVEKIVGRGTGGSRRPRPKSGETSR